MNLVNLTRLCVLGVMAVAVVISGMIIAPTADAQSGTRLKRSIHNENIFWFSQPKEIGQVRSLLQKGEIQKAIEVAAQSVDHLDTSADISSGSVFSQEYFARNAYCGALTMGGRLDDAMEQCDEAVKIDSRQWQALNSRGTVHLLAERRDAARSDYEAALAVVGSDQDARELIERNIRLVDERPTS